MSKSPIKETFPRRSRWICKDHALQLVKGCAATLLGAALILNASAVDLTSPNPGFGGLSFDGTNDYVTMGVASGLGTQTFTLESWVYWTGGGATSSAGGSDPASYPVITKGRGEADTPANVNCNYYFGIGTTGLLNASFEDKSNGSNHPVTGVTTVTTNAWHHVAVTYDGSTWKLYLDGVLDKTQTESGTGNSLLPENTSIQHFALGTAMNSSGIAAGYFAGKIDEARVWNYARSQAQIAGAMNSEIATATGLLGRWSLNETSGTVATNNGSVGSAGNGTLTNGPAFTTGYPLAPAANQAPSVSIASPTNNSSVETAFTIAATANDSDGTITSVSFFDGATPLGVDTTSPYSFALTGAALGSHSLTAVALDNGGLSSTSAVITVNVVSNHAPLITPTAPADLATGIGSSTTVSADISDQDGDAQTVTFYGRRTAPAVPAADFSIVAIPDTQFYSENAARNPSTSGNPAIDTGAVASIYNAQTQWCVDHRLIRKIAFVSHMGDIVQNGDSKQSEWQVADAAQKLIENPATTLRAHGLPWGVAPGNHDQQPIGDAGGATNYFNQYFHFSRWDKRPYYGGHFSTKNNNNYQLFSAGGLDFIIIHLEYDKRAKSFYQPVLDWADALLKAHPDRRAIVTSHWIINTGNPASFSTQGQNIYDDLKDNPNFFLLLCGHVHGEGRRSDTFATRTVHSILHDYQDAKNGGNGFLRILTFKPSTNQIRVESYSPTLNRAVDASDAILSWSTAYDLSYNMQGAVTDWIPLGTVNVPANGTTASLDWTGLEAGKDYEWRATANDGIFTATSTTRRFSTAPPAVPVVALTSPTHGASFAANTTINLEATATDSDGSISRVEFFDGGTKLGEATASPFTFAWNGASAGNHVLTAVATDHTGLDAISSTTSIIVNAVPGSGTLIRGAYLQKAGPSTMTICWRSSQSVAGRVKFGTSADALTNTVNESSSKTDHEVTLTGLTANTTYFYSIGSALDTLASGADYTFTTPPTIGAAMPTRIWALGDAGTANANQGAVRDAFYAWTGSRTPNLVLQLGDNAYDAGTDTEFQNAMFNMYSTMLRKTPFWSCLGNHETNQATAFVNTYPYFNIYSLPTAGECGGLPSGTEHYYSFDYGNIHLISLDSMTADRSPTGAMAIWLKNDLASTTATWIIAFFHHPPYTKGSHNSDTEAELVQMRTNLLPFLETGGVDLVLCGHSHCYERSYLLDGHYGVSSTLTPAMKMNAGDGRPSGNGSYIKPLTGVRSHSGAVYAVTGSAGKISGGSLNHPAHFISMNNLGSLVLDVNGTRLDATFIRENSSIPDTFTIIKQDKATPTITTPPTATSITIGQTLADSTLTGGVASVPGGFAFTTPSTAPGLGTAPQSVTFTPADTQNYHNALTSASVTVLDRFETWISTCYSGLTGAEAEPGADPDKDGMTNQEEFAFGLNPTSGASMNPIAVELDKASGKFSYTRHPLTGLTYSVWTSTDLQVWSKDAGAVEGTPTLMDDIETVPVTLSTSLAGASNFFVQMRAR